MTTSVVGQRTPVAIDDGLIRAGSQTAAFDRAAPETLLRNYLRLIRRARSQQRAPEISLRREDVEALADYLGVTFESVLHRLATLMGSSRTQRNTMLAAFASGALLVGLSGSVAASSRELDNAAPDPAQVAVAATAVDEVQGDSPADVSTAASGSETAAAATSVVSAPAGAATPGRSTVIAGDTDAERTASAVQLVESASTPAAGAAASDRPAGGQPAPRGGSGSPVSDVALVAPLSPDDVAVGDAVVPPTTSAPNDAVDAGSGAVEPPVTETTTAPTDDIPQELPPVDDETVAVGPPPLPPTTTTSSTTTTTPATTTTTIPPTTTTTTPTTTTPTTTTTSPPTTTTTTSPPTTTTIVPPTTDPVETLP